MPKAAAKATPFRDPMALLARLAGDAMKAGADPSVAAGPDDELLALCDQITTIKRHVRLLSDACSRVEPGAPFCLVYKERQRVDRTSRSAILRCGKLRAMTPAGLYAKAVAVGLCSDQATFLAKSLAADLLQNVELRKALWPAEVSA